MAHVKVKTRYLRVGGHLLKAAGSQQTRRRVWSQEASARAIGRINDRRRLEHVQRLLMLVRSLPTLDL